MSEARYWVTIKETRTRSRRTKQVVQGEMHIGANPAAVQALTSNFEPGRSAAPASAFNMQAVFEASAAQVAQSIETIIQFFYFLFNFWCPI